MRLSEIKPEEFGLMGLRVRTTRAPSDVMQWLRDRWESQSLWLASVPSRIGIAFRPTAPWKSTPRHDSVETIATRAGPVTWLRHGERWWSTGPGDVGVELRLAGEEASIYAWHDGWHPSRMIAPPPESTAPVLHALHAALCETLRARGLVPLHAAVVARDGTATAFLGRSGTGKSSTLLSALAAGWHPLAEDFVWLDPATSRVHAWRGDRGVRLTEDGLRRLPAHWRFADWRREDDGRFLARYEGISATRPQIAELTRIFVLHRDAGRDAEVEQLSPDDAMRALRESAGVSLCRLNRASFEAQVPRLLSRLEWLRLVLGGGAPASQ